MLSQVKLIAEPWDVGAGGYQVGNFPPPWTEWNGKYRDTVRDFWARGARRRARPGLPADRVVGPVPATTAGRRSPASTSSPPTTASPCATWSPTSTSTTRPTARTTATATTTTATGTAASRGRADDPDGPARCGAGRCATCWPRCCSRPGVPMLVGRRRAGPHPAAATTTPTARTTRSPGWTGRTSEPRTCSRSSAGCSRCAAASPVLRQEAFFEGRDDARATAAHGPGLVRTRRRRADRPATGSTPGCGRSACTWTGAASGTADSAASRSSTTPTCVLLHAGARAGDGRSCPGRPGPTATSWSCSTEYPTGAPPAPTIIAPGPIELAGRTVWVLRVLACGD